MCLVTATVKDPNGNLYTNAAVECIFLPNPPANSGQYYSISGSPFQTFAVGNTDSFGNLSIQLPGNDLVSPSGSSWRFNVIDRTRTVGFSVAIVISGSTQDISAALQAAAANLPGTTFQNITATGLTVNGATQLNGTLNVTGTATLSGGGTLSGTFAGNPTFSGNVTVSGTLNLTGALTTPGGLNNIQTITSATTGADICAKIVTGITALGSTGGTVDARFFQGAQACASNPLAAQAFGCTNGITLLLGNVAISTSVAWVITCANIQIIGNGWQQTSLKYTGGATAAALFIGTSTPTVNQLLGVYIAGIQVSGNANTTDAIFMTGNHHAQLMRVDARNATGACFHTAFDVIGTFVDISCTLNHGAFTTQPANGILISQIDASHPTTATNIISPTMEGLSGTACKVDGGANINFWGGTCEQSNRGAEITTGAGKNRNVVFDGVDMELNITEDVLDNGLNSQFRSNYTSTQMHLGSTSFHAKLVGGITNSILIDAGALNATIDTFAYNNGGTGTFTDNGTDTMVIGGLINNATNLKAPAPWWYRWSNQAFTVPAVATIDKQDTILGSYTFTTVATVISNTVYTAAKPWTLIWRGSWVNNVEGGGLIMQPRYIECTSALPSFLIGTQTVNCALNGSNQFSITSTANTIGFSGRIDVVSHNSGAAGTTTSLLLKNAVEGPQFTVPEGTAPAAVAAKAVLYADSTAHALELSNNNGSFFRVGQVITATSAAFATATTAATCVQNTTAVTGAATSMACSCAPVSTPGIGSQWSCFVSSAGNVTINECAVAASAGGTIAFNIRLIV